jgi:hypothetical protein
MHIALEDGVRDGTVGGKNPQNHFSNELFRASKHQFGSILFLPAPRVRATIGPNGESRPVYRVGVLSQLSSAFQLREETPHDIRTGHAIRAVSSSSDALH